VIGTLAAFLLAISFPALLKLAYELVPESGGQAYSALELVLSAGVFVGSLMVSRLGAIGSLRTIGAGLLLTGAFSVAIATHLPIAIVAVALFIASFGNPIYAVGNQTALVEAADSSTRGSVMATRFGLVQTASIIGTGVGGLITEAFSAEAAYGVLGIGLVMLALYAFAAGRSTVNPLHGQAYEEATALRQAKT